MNQVESRFQIKEGTYISCERLSKGPTTPQYFYVATDQDPAYLVNLKTGKIWKYSITERSVGPVEKGLPWGLGSVDVEVLSKDKIPAINQEDLIRIVNQIKNERLKKSS